ncbi:MAG TPA: hypothetical protein VGT41_05925 [Candidatus Babeliales bacterium]|nr:hypothetical protein [Candidatus Babeliales bacterium]
MNKTLLLCLTISFCGNNLYGMLTKANSLKNATLYTLSTIIKRNHPQSFTHLDQSPGRRYTRGFSNHAISIAQSPTIIDPVHSQHIIDDTSTQCKPDHTHALNVHNEWVQYTSLTLSLFPSKCDGYLTSSVNGDSKILHPVPYEPESACTKKCQWPLKRQFYNAYVKKDCHNGKPTISPLLSVLLQQWNPDSESTNAPCGATCYIQRAKIAADYHKTKSLSRN